MCKLNQTNYTIITGGAITVAESKQENTPQELAKILDNYKVKSVRVAKDFGYPQYVITRINNALSCDEISDILMEARKAQ